MSILTLGVSFRRAPIELLERLAFSDDDLAKAYRVSADLDGIGGAVILSTCNRVEVYGDVSSYHAGFLALQRCSWRRAGIAAGSSPIPSTRTGSAKPRSICSPWRAASTPWCSGRRRSTRRFATRSDDPRPRARLDQSTPW